MSGFLLIESGGQKGVYAWETHRALLGINSPFSLILLDPEEHRIPTIFL